ncbi:hypothetical protein Rsub_05025 [Raphidocelis subcapitata]|uniref:SMP-30/Gluconolactonase/LRE-like region domain-containing protein n=1 Tax=Raphidocelis subcapitata TaxID=307507 RepID=A0A2V0NYG5_9CHLO|nr:hypothetical protein Rsub_05025 [Raphidocelis subcapitata]|eukprot:GBF92656.1 hypothetical protein Rsub_05025 [Raphidocelis subcapitata]
MALQCSGRAPTALRARRGTAPLPLLALALLVLCGGAAAKEVGCRSKFGPYIEGAAVDKAGNVYAVSWDRKLGSVGKVATAGDGACSAAAATPANVIGLRVLPDGSFLGAGFDGKKVVLIKDGATTTFCADPAMVSPNDLAISPKTGFVYVSGQAWKDNNAVGDGDVWLCRGKGAPAVRLAQLGRTNGIEVSADGGWLFVSESFNKGGNPVSNVIWRFPIAADGAIDAAKKELVIDFEAADGSGKTDVDGMRLDAAGRLYVTRHNGAAVVVVDPMGTNKVLERIPLPFSAPTNLEFGGPDGKTLYVVGRCGFRTPYGTGDGCIEAIDRPVAGLYWSNLQKGLPKVAV